MHIVKPETSSTVTAVPPSSNTADRLLIPDAPALLMQDNYPDARFWTRAEWNKYAATKAERGSPVHKLGFVTDEEGRMVSEERLGMMSKFSKTNWAELHYERLDPNHWSGKTKSASDYFGIWMAIQFVEFRLCEGSWKAEAFATARYPDWKATRVSVTLLRTFSYICS